MINHLRNDFILHSNEFGFDAALISRLPALLANRPPLTAAPVHSSTLTFY